MINLCLGFHFSVGLCWNYFVIKIYASKEVTHSAVWRFQWAVNCVQAIRCQYLLIVLPQRKNSIFSGCPSGRQLDKPHFFSPFKCGNCATKQGHTHSWYMEVTMLPEVYLGMIPNHFSIIGTFFLLVQTWEIKGKRCLKGVWQSSEGRCFCGAGANTHLVCMIETDVSARLKRGNHLMQRRISISILSPCRKKSARCGGKAPKIVGSLMYFGSWSKIWWVDQVHLSSDWRLMGVWRHCWGPRDLPPPPIWWFRPHFTPPPAPI